MHRKIQDFDLIKKIKEFQDDSKSSKFRKVVMEWTKQEIWEIG